MLRKSLEWAARCMQVILFAAIALAFAPRAVHAGLEGTWKASERVYDDGRESTLTYTLILSDHDKAELITERSSYINHNGNIGNDYGSIVTVYLRDRSKVSHVGKWSSDNDYVNISLTDIIGRRDKCNFSGNYEDGSLDLSCSNRGMYGDRPNFRFRKDNGGGGGGKIKTGDAIAIGAAAVVLGAIIAEESRKQRVRNVHEAQEKDKADGALANPSDKAAFARTAGEYAFTESVSGSSGLKFRLALDPAGVATLTTLLKGDPQATSSNESDCGEILRLAIRDYRIEHSGTYRVNGDSIEVNLKSLRSKTKTEDRAVTLKGKWRDGAIQFKDFGDTKLYGIQETITFKATD